jgi:hypothetical protein
MSGIIPALPLNYMPIAVDTNWGVSSGASPRALPDRTLRVPVGNPGDILLDITITPAGTFAYRKNSGSWTTFTDNTVVTGFVNGDTLGFQLTGGGDTGAVSVKDNTAVVPSATPVIGTGTITTS